MAYRFSIAEGDSDLHKAARDLFYLVRHPFGSSLELLPELAPSNLYLQNTMVNWKEAAVGATLEPTWELQSCGLPADRDALLPCQQNLQAAQILARVKSGQFVDQESRMAWHQSTPPAF